MSRAPGRDWPLTFWSIAEPAPGPAWQHVFATTWPGYRSWYLREGSAARPDLATCQRALASHMPELVPTWQRMVELAGGDPMAARMLTMYNPPAYLTGCSQAVYRGDPPALVRNYDYAPQLHECVVLGSAYTGRRVIGMSDCLWGLVDGMNDAGLAASLAFGGRRVVGTGFGVPLVLRYLLEVCDTARSARRTLARLPVHMAYNITVVDRSGEYFTAFVGPDRPPSFVDQPVATNHQTSAGSYRPAGPAWLDWPAQARATHSLERHAALTALVGDPHVDLDGLAARFLAPPLYSTGYELGFGTLYTAIYQPVDLAVEYRWPGSSWRHSIAGLTPGEHRVVLVG